MNSDGGVCSLDGDVSVWHSGEDDEVLQHFFYVVHGGTNRRDICDHASHREDFKIWN